MDLGLGDRGYLLTGASRGLGFATARALVDDGVQVLISSRSADTVSAAAEELGGCAGRLRYGGGARRPRCRRAARHRGPRAPGQGGRRADLGRRPGTWDGVADPRGPVAGGVESILLGPLRLVRALVPHLGNGAAIVFVLSSTVREPTGGLAISNGLRPGPAMTAKALADELGPRCNRVFGLMPGTIATDRIAEIEGASGDVTAARARPEEAIPLRRVGPAEEFGRVAAFALSPAVSHLTGTMILVDGGRLRSP